MQLYTDIRGRTGPQTTRQGRRAIARLGALLAAFIVALGAVVAVPNPSWAAANQVCAVAPGGSIQAQINDPNCATIEIAAAIFTENLTIARSLVLQGAGPLSTSIDGGGSGRVITVSGAGVEVELRDLRVANGNASSAPVSARYGGGILAYQGATVRIGNVRVENNTAFAGFTFSGFGGGIAVREDATLHATDLYLANNLASGSPGTGFGGGLSIVQGSAYLTQTQVYSNTGNFRAAGFGDGRGGGIYVTNSESRLGMWDSEVKYNVATSSAAGGDGFGGALFAGNSTYVTIMSTVFENNVAAAANASGDSGDGGAIAINTGSSDTHVSISNSSFIGNQANARQDVNTLGEMSRGGAIYADPGSAQGRITVTVTNSSLIDNIAKAGTGSRDGQGGAIFGRRVDITVIGGEIRGNIAATNNSSLGQGGGIRMSGVGDTSLVVDGVTFLNNVARIGTGGSETSPSASGGAIHASGADAVITVINSIMGDNRAASGDGGAGAGIYVAAGASGTVVHTTIASSGVSPLPAQGILHANYGGMNIVNSIVANYQTGIHNQGSTGAVVANRMLYWDNTSNTVGSVGSVIGQEPIVNDPAFVDAPGGDYHILPTSAARDAGVDAGINVDIDGDMRPQGLGFDIGADEYANVPVSMVSISGPGSVIASQLYTYTAETSPPNAESPIQYMWEPAPLNQQGLPTAVYSWTMTGTQTISVTATNAEGAGSATASRTISVTSEVITATALAISGPTSGNVSQTYGFTATVSPPDASAPFTYTWTPLPDSGQGTSLASYSWMTPGVKTITATAQNVGSPVTATHTITIAAIGVTGVAISGPSSGAPNEIYIYNASVSPVGASQPISYTWSPEPLSGQNTSQAAYTWPTTGTQPIQVTAQNIGGSATDMRTVTIESLPVTGVSIQGPTNTQINQPNSYAAQVSPANAQLPIEYEWSPTPGEGQGTETAVYTWTVSGSNSITVTVSNLGGSAEATASRTVTATTSAVGVSGASISGPTNLVVERTYRYTGTVSPVNATAPLTYTWSPTPNEGQGTPNAQYRWDEPGTRTITFTVQNSGGSATATRMLNVSEEFVAVTGVSISGPMTGTVDMSYAYTATASPSDAGDPITYSWSPMPESGQGTHQVSYRWETTGTKTITVTAQNNGGPVTQTRTVTITAPTPDPDPDPENEVAVGNNFFAPASITIQVGETVTWRRLEGFHNVRAEDGSFGNELSDSWTTYSYTFTEPGTYPYYCEAHGQPGGINMAGVVIVVGDGTDPEEETLYVPSATRN